jgi:ABC-type nickel/cobalt efflux system permease component RcnA
MRSPLAAFAVLALVVTATGHTFPDQRAEREINVRISDTTVRVKYKLEINAITMAVEGNQILKKDDYGTIKGPRDLARVYAKRKAALLMDGLDAKLNDGDRLEWAHNADKLDITAESDQQFILRFEFDAAWNPPPGGTSKFVFEDHTFQNSDGTDTFPGKVVLTLAEFGTALSVSDVNDPRGLQGKSPLTMTPKEKRQLRTATAEFTRRPQGRSSSLPPAAAETTSSPLPPQEKPGLVEGMWKNGLSSLFDSDAGIGLLLLAALVFGAGHAFTPGHGKTLVAAYLVGERGTIRHALVLGLSTTIAHTGSVIALACALWYFYGSNVPKEAQGWLQFAGGMLIFLVGLWLLQRRLAGKADHVHFGAGHHHHHHGHDHDHVHVHGPDCDHHHHHDHPPEKTGWLRVVLLGIGGGLVPCWDAVMLLFLAISFGRLAFAVPLLVAFSVGLAAVLVLLGVAVVLAHRAGGKKYGERKWFRRLPIISAALLVLMGLWLARDGVQMLMPAKPTPALSE